MIPTSGKPAWVSELEASQALLEAHARSNGPHAVASELMFSLDGIAYAAIETAPLTYTVLGPRGSTVITTTAPLTEPEWEASDEAWDAYLEASNDFQTAVRAAHI